MGKILIGLLFAFFDLNFSNGSLTINALPDFVGCLLVWIGIRELANKYDNDTVMVNGERIALAATVYSFIEYFIEMFGVFNNNTIGLVILGVIYLLISLAMTYQLVEIVGVIERKTQMELGSFKIKKWWKYMAVFNGLTVLCLLAANMSANATAATAYIVCNVMCIVCNVLYILNMNKARMGQKI